MMIHNTRKSKLMVSGFICGDIRCTLSTEVRRGMPILSDQGVEVGKVAAIKLDRDKRLATHLLLDRLPERSGYWLVPVDLIAKVDSESVQLTINDKAVETLPRWHES